MTHRFMKCSIILCSSWRQFDPLLVNIKEIIWVRATCGMQYWNCGLHFQKRKLIPNLSQSIRGPTWSGASHLSHSFPMILWGCTPPVPCWRSCEALTLHAYPIFAWLTWVLFLGRFSNVTKCLSWPHYQTSPHFTRRRVLLFSLGPCYILSEYLRATDSVTFSCANYPLHH